MFEIYGEVKYQHGSAGIRKPRDNVFNEYFSDMNEDKQKAVGEQRTPKGSGCASLTWMKSCRNGTQILRRKIKKELSRSRMQSVGDSAAFIALLQYYGAGIVCVIFSRFYCCVRRVTD